MELRIHSWKQRLPHYLEILYLLVQKELRVRYKSSVLGYVWALINPVAFACVYYVAFKTIMHVQMPNYAIFLLTGIFPWNWLSQSLVNGTGCFRNNASLVKRVQMERSVLPLATVMQEMIHFLFALPVLIAFILISRQESYLSWLWQIPMLLVLQLLFLYPITILLSLFNVLVHDVEYLVGIALSLLFFLTPIVYSPEIIPENYRHYFMLSPLAALMGNWRSVLLHGQVDSLALLYCVCISMVLGACAFFCYRRIGPGIGELL